MRGCWIATTCRDGNHNHASTGFTVSKTRPSGAASGGDARLAPRGLYPARERRGISDVLALGGQSPRPHADCPRRFSRHTE